MISVQEAINKFRRDGAVSTLLKAAFVAAAVHRGYPGLLIATDEQAHDREASAV